MIATDPKLRRMASLMTPHAFAVSASEGHWKPYRWLKTVGRIIADAVEEGNQRIIINGPPRHGKSEFDARWVPAWFLERYPHKRVIVGANGDTLAVSHGRFIRDQIEQNPYFTVRLAKSSHAAHTFNTTAGGGLYCAGVGTNIMGFGGHLIVIDDPYGKWADAQSETYRQNVIEWYDKSVRTRCEPNATIIILHHRMHVEDLTGVLMDKQPEVWKQIVLPAIAEHDGDPMGRKLGDPLCPERYDLAALLEMKKNELGGEFGWVSMYQQRPVAMAAMRAYRYFTESHKSNTVGYNPMLPLQISFDFNIDPGMYCEIGQYDPATDQLTTVEEIFEPSLSLKTLLQMLEPVLTLHPWREIQIFGDASGSARSASTGESNYDMIRDKFKRLRDEGRLKVGCTMNVPLSNGPIVDSLAVANDCLSDVAGDQHFKVHPRCTRLIRDLEQVKIDKNGQPIKSNQELTHAGDAWRYRVKWLRPIGGPVKQTESEFVFAESPE